MRISVFNGSPRAERGNTHVMVEAFREGAEAAGAETELHFLAGKKIQPCLGCHACWARTPGRCVQSDDMAELMEAVNRCDVLTFATPVYVDNVTGLMKQFMDRLIPIADPRIEQDDSGESRHPRRHPKPTKLAVISNCGFPEQSHFQVLRLLFRRIARNLSCELAAEIYRGAGGLLTSSRAELDLPVRRYHHLLVRAGRELVEHGWFLPDTVEELEQPLIPTKDFPDIFRREANRMWAKILG